MPISGNITGKVKSDILDYLVENGKARDREHAISEISNYTWRELFDMYLTWNGIIGFTDDILEARDMLYRSDM